MYKHLLIATDGSALASHAVEQGLALARDLKAAVSALTVTVPFHMISTDPTVITETPRTYDADMRKEAEKTLIAVASAAERQGVRVETIHLVEDHPWEAILETARARGCDLIVMASHGHGGFRNFLLGSEVAKVLSHGHLPVLVVRPPEATTARR